MSWAQFDYKSYLERFGIRGILSVSKKIEKLPPQDLVSQQIIEAQKVRKRFEKNIKEKLPSPHHLIASGVLLGIEEKLPKSTEENFINAGLQHILVVSGSNVALILLLLHFLLRPLGPIAMGSAAVAGLVFFLAVVGPDPPVIRAVIFGLVTTVALLIGRFVDVRNLILLAATIMALLAPQIVRARCEFFLNLCRRPWESF